jgi:hypothetical protein
MNQKIKLVKFKNTLKTFHSSATMVEAIIQKIYAIPNYTNLRGDVELILFICSSIENGLKSDVTVDKKQTAIDIMKRVFPDLSADELTFIGNSIDFLANNNCIVKFSNWYHFFC